MEQNKLPIDKELILEKHCPSMSLLYLDDNGRAFRKRILIAMEEYTLLNKTALELLSEKYTTLQAKCKRYEDALMRICSCSSPIGVPQLLPVRIAQQALSEREVEKEEKEVGNDIIVVHNNSDAFRDWVTKVKGYSIALLLYNTGVCLPDGITKEMFEKEWEEYEKANNPKYKKDAKQ